MLDFNTMTPFELGESKSKEALPHLVVHLHNGSDNDKRLSASAVIKLTKEGINCTPCIPFLLRNLSSDKPQVRQYTLKALKEFALNEEYYPLIKDIYVKEDKEYNRGLAKELLSKFVQWYLDGEDKQFDSSKEDKPLVIEKTEPENEIVEKGYVYFIQEDFSSKVKIGKTKNMIQRLDTFNVKLPFDIKLLHIIESQNHHYTEKLFHVYFDSKRVNGEWFDLSEDDIFWIKNGKYTKRIMDSLETPLHTSEPKKKITPITAKQIEFLSNLLTKKNAILMKPIKQLSVDEGAALISYFYRGEELTEEMHKLIFYKDNNQDKKIATQ